MSKYKIEEIKYKFTVQGRKPEEGRFSDLIRKKGAKRINCISQAGADSAKGTLEIYRNEVFADGTEKVVPLLTQPAVELRDFETDLTREVIALSHELDIDLLLEDTLESPSEKGAAVEGENQDEGQGEGLDVGFALLDYRLVHNSLLDIRSCRTHIFMGTLGIIGAVAVAILSILGSVENSANSSSWRTWLLWASLVPIGLLAVAIMTTIHKTQNLAKRLSYLEVLSEYLRKKDFKIPHWSGWKKANRVLERCTAHHSDACVNHKCKVAMTFLEKHPKVDKPTPKENVKEGTDKETQKEKKYKILWQFCCRIWRDMFGEKKTTPVCARLAKTHSADGVKGVRLLPNFLYSFASLSMYVYITILFIASVGLLSNLAVVIKDHEGFTMGQYLSAVFIGLIVGVILTSLHLWSRGKKLERRLNKCLNIIYIVVSSGLILVLSISILKANYAGADSNHLSAVVGYVLGATIAGVVVYSAYSFYRKLDKLRRGKDSIERMRMHWAIMFKHCPLMDEKTNVSLSFE